jgi:chaperonin cofactor prefoldin
MATLPKQVRNQIEEAERIAKEIETLQDNPPAEQSEPEPVEDGVVEEVVEEVVEVEEPQGGEVEQPVAAEDENSETYKQRWSTLQGMMEAKTRETQELRERVASLEGMLSKLSEMKASEPAEPEPAKDEPPKSLLKQEEIEDYGPDLIDVMKRAAREAVADEIRELRAENTSLKQLVGGVGQKLETNDRQAFYAKLDTVVDSWRSLNRDPEFLSWLSQQDVYAGETRQSLLGRAFEANDVNRVASFFKGYLKETAAVAEATSEGQPPKQATVPSSGKVPLDTLAAPGANNSGSADNTSQRSGRMWKESEIGAFYEDARKGKFKGRDAEYRRTENQIQAALSQGRILLGQ